MAIKSIACAWAPVADWEATRSFWQDKVGLVIHQDYSPHWMEFTVEGDSAVLACHPGPVEGVSGNSIVTFDVDDIEADVARLTAAGVEFVGGIQEEPGVVRLAMFKDPSGNLFQLGQNLISK